MERLSEPAHGAEAPSMRSAGSAPLSHSPIPETILDAMTDGFLTLDADGVVLAANRAASRLLGIHTLVGRHADGLFSRDSQLERALRAGQDAHLILRPTEISFMSDPVETTLVPHGDGTGSCDVLLQGAAFKTSRERRLFYQASHDQLTGFYNRRMFEEHLRREVAASPRSGSVALLLIGVDGISEYAAEAGRAAADNLILWVADRLQSESGTGRQLARISDCEFALTLRDTPTGLAVLFAERLVCAVRETGTAGSRPWNVVLDADGSATVPRVTLRPRVGIAIHPDSGESSAELLRAADRALCRARRSGCDHSVAPA